MLIIALLIGYIFMLPRHLFNVPYSTIIYDRNGELLGGRISTDGQWRFPPIDTVPEKYVTALVCYEDKRYFYHLGIDPIALGRAAYYNFRKKSVVSGGSTLTMQTIRLSRQKKRTYREKFVEILWATRLELRYSKREILALYASHAPFGGNIVGLEAASWRYFNHPAEQLSWAEATTLAILPNAPSMIHPGKNRDNLLKKRNALLKKLYENKKITDIEYELACDETLPDATFTLPQSAPHLVDYFYLNDNGRQVKTTIDKQVQIHVENIVNQWHQEFFKQDIRNLAAIVIDINTNEVIAYCGNIKGNKFKNGNQVDIIRAPRSTGSVLKPLLYYTALEDGVILQNTLLPDIPININGFMPQNFNRQYDGAVPASEAISRSLNVPSTNLLQQYGVPKFYNFLKKIGMTTLSYPSSHYGLSIILGGAETTLWDITGIYSNMARSLKGLSNAPIMVEKSDQKKAKNDFIFDAGAVWLTFESIKELNRPEELDWHSISSMQTIAWKTGTSYGFRDAWSIGVTPKYAVGVWVGNSDGEGMPGLIGARTAAPVMFDIFNYLPHSKWFSIPSGVFVDAEICTLSGHIKSRFCNTTDTIQIMPKGERTTACPYHQLVNVSNGDNDAILDQEVAFILPPAWAWYYKNRHPDYEINQNVNSATSDNSLMQFIYPTNETTYISLPKQLDGSQGKITFKLVHTIPNINVFWHIDGNYFTSTLDFHQITVNLSAGKHVIMAVDERGNLQTRIVIVQ